MNWDPRIVNPLEWPAWWARLSGRDPSGPNDQLVQALEASLQGSTLDQAVLSSWETVAARFGQPWDAKSCARVVACARIAAVVDGGPADRERMTRELSEIFGGERAGSVGSEPWKDCVRRVIFDAREGSIFRPKDDAFSPTAAWDLVLRFWNARGVEQESRTPDASVSLVALLVDGERGATAQLTLERLPGGSGLLYPDPAVMAFVFRDDGFRDAERHAVECCRHLGLWDDASDVRWSLARLDWKELTRISEGSAGAAFALGLARLGSAPREVGDVTIHYTLATRDLARRLEEVDLTQVAVSAEINPADTGWALGPVDGFWQKLGAAIEDSSQRGVLRVVVGADGQTGVGPSPVPVKLVTTIEAAVEALYEDYGARAAVRAIEENRSARMDVLGNAATLTDYYQVLPLLEEVRVKVRPRESPDEGATQRAGEAARQQSHWLQWEERQPREEKKYKARKIEDILCHGSHLSSGPPPRILVLGPPGSGKSTLEQYIAYRVAQKTLRVRGRPMIPARLSLRQWENDCLKAGDATPLNVYLATRYKDDKGVPGASEDRWDRWLSDGDVLLLLDGLDETSASSGFKDALRSLLQIHSPCPAVLTCRTVSYEIFETAVTATPLEGQPRWRVCVLAGFGRGERDEFVGRSLSTWDRTIAARGLIDELDRRPELSVVASNPLLLTIVCAIFREDGATPASRVALYERATRLILARRKPLGPHAPHLVDTLWLLECVALRLFESMSDPRHDVFTDEVVKRELEAAAARKGLANPPNVASDLLAWLTDTGLLRKLDQAGETSYFFMHLTFHEFLTARAIARVVNEGGWNGRIELRGKAVTARVLVDRKSWDPKWREIVRMTAGEVEDVGPLLETLADATTDDLLRQRLDLAGQCLAEVWDRGAIPGRPIVGHVLAELLRRWDASLRVSVVTLPASAEGVRALLSRDLAGRLASNERQRVEDWINRSNPRHLGLLGEPAARHPRVIQALLDSLNARDDHVRRGAIEALGCLGEPAAGHPSVIPGLLDSLNARDKYVRGSAAETLGRLGRPAACHPRVIPALLDGLKDDEEWVRRTVAEALGRFGEDAAQHPRVIPALLDGLKDDAKTVRQTAARALGCLGEPAARHPQVLSALLKALEEYKRAEDEYCREATEALGRLGELAAQHPRVIPALLHSLNADSWWGRSCAAQALGLLGEAATRHPQVIPALAKSLNEDVETTVRRYAAEALGLLGELAARHPRVVAGLLHELKAPDADLSVRCRAIEALGRLGETAAQDPQVILALLGSLNARVDSERRYAAEALGRVGEPAAQDPQVIPALLGSLHAGDDSERRCAAEALGRLGERAARHPRVIPALLRALRPTLLEHFEDAIIWACLWPFVRARRLRQPALQRHGGISDLDWTLARDIDLYVRRCRARSKMRATAAEALRRLGATAHRYRLLGVFVRYRASTIRDLSSL